MERNSATNLHVRPGQKDEGLVISNENNLIVLKLKKAGAIVEIDYASEKSFEEKFINFFKNLSEDDIVNMRILRSKGNIIQALPSEIFLTYELQASKKIVEHLEKLVDGLNQVLQSKEMEKNPSRAFVKEEIKHASNNIEKFNKRMKVARKLLERYKTPKIKRSYKKKMRRRSHSKAA